MNKAFYWNVLVLNWKVIQTDWIGTFSPDFGLSDHCLKVQSIYLNIFLLCYILK